MLMGVEKLLYKSDSAILCTQIISFRAAPETMRCLVASSSSRCIRQFPAEIWTRIPMPQLMRYYTRQQAPFLERRYSPHPLTLPSLPRTSIDGAGCRLGGSSLRGKTGGAETPSSGPCLVQGTPHSLHYLDRLLERVYSWSELLPADLVVPGLVPGWYHGFFLEVSTGTGIMSHFVNLHIVVPEAFILGSGEHHVDVGSGISLVCIIEKIEILGEEKRVLEERESVCMREEREREK
uniref:Uncharacterized protein n=1 Tax=Timema shepardi TaxID=629360 RepID=A0A7R9AK02_TIMSH|nr:unnamed protein product [Timema shepardi]